MRNQNKTGGSAQVELDLERSGNAVSFDYDVRNFPTDDVREGGPLDGTAFTARNASQSIRFPSCGDDSMLTGTLDESVEGHFSEDFKHLTAKEQYNYHFGSGDVTVFFDWSADPR